MPQLIQSDLPYGIGELIPPPRSKAKQHTVRCYVRDCEHEVRTPTRSTRGDRCPEHGIVCHHSTAGGTYTYGDPRRNIIVSADLMKEKVIGHPFKFESHRLGLERSEDALSWNVFRSLQEAGVLGRFAYQITGDRCPFEPQLLLWGIDCSDESFESWDLLIRGRKQFESCLPVDRPFTEPDIALFLPGRYLILIEAKFTSCNTFYERGPRRASSSLTLEELLHLYAAPELQILDYAKAASVGRIYYQLWRNMTFAEWMAKQDHPATRAFHVNLVRRGQDEASASAFAELVQPDFRDRFQQWSWESLYELYRDTPALSRLRRYLETKTAGLRAAFNLPRGCP